MKQLSDYLYVSSFSVILITILDVSFIYVFPVALILLFIAVMLHLLVDHKQSNTIYIILDTDSNELISSHKTLEDCLKQYDLIIKNNPNMYMKIESCVLN